MDGWRGTGSTNSGALHQTDALFSVNIRSATFHHIYRNLFLRHCVGSHRGTSAKFSNLHLKLVQDEVGALERQRDLLHRQMSMPSVTSSTASTNSGSYINPEADISKVSTPHSSSKELNASSSENPRSASGSGSGEESMKSAGSNSTPRRHSDSCLNNVSHSHVSFDSQSRGDDGTRRRLSSTSELLQAAFVENERRLGTAHEKLKLLHREQTHADEVLLLRL